MSTKTSILHHAVASINSSIVSGPGHNVFTAAGSSQ